MRPFLKLAALLFALPVCLAACSRGMQFVTARVSPEGEASATLSEGGVHQVLINPGRQTPRWDGFMLDNQGASRVQNVRLWGIGPIDLIAPTTGSFTPFTLRPGERFLCRETPQGLEGSFLWQMPVDPAAATAGIERLHRGRIEPGRGIVMRPAGGEAWVQIAVDAPFDHTGARLGWEVRPPKALSAWASVDGRAWGQVGGSPAGTWLKPLDISSAIQGKRRFWVRLLAPAGTGEIVVEKLRLERDILAVGHIRAWRPGINESTIAFDAPKGALLEFKLLN